MFLCELCSTYLRQNVHYKKRALQKHMNLKCVAINFLKSDYKFASPSPSLKRMIDV